jgi:hypothetical protein
LFDLSSPRIAECGLLIVDWHPNLQSPSPNQKIEKSAISNQQSAISNQQFATSSSIVELAVARAWRLCDSGKGTARLRTVCISLDGRARPLNP